MKLHVVINDAINVLNAYQATGCHVAPQRRTVEFSLTEEQIRLIKLGRDEMIESVTLNLEEKL